VFNGEIYNYLELRDELAAKGYNFQSQSDTEVLLAAYQHWDTECFARLNGFWAIALFDFRRRRLIVSRDRLGKRPLYWTRCGSRIYFASEIKALLRVPDVYRARKVNEDVISRWLIAGQKDLEFSTCFEGIYSLPSASWAVVDTSFPDSVRRFWVVPSKRLAETDISPVEAARDLRSLLVDAVHIRLRSDVPLSVELSGGMDSSTLVAIAAQVQRERIQTYTVRFPEESYNEEPFARSVARHYNTDYRVLDSPSGGFWRHILPFTYLEEEPYHSPNLQTNQAIWSQMRAMGTKVSLNGAGGDENFAGYSTYYIPAQVQHLLEWRFGAYVRNAVRYSQGRTNLRGGVQPIMLLLKEWSGRLALPSFHSEATLPNILGCKRLPRLSRLSTLSEVLYSDMTNTLMPYWLRSGDRGFMGIPLEVRAPFLDYRVVEFAFRLPVTYLFRDGWHKWILRKAVEELLPADVVWRRRKMGFPFPSERFHAENCDILNFILDNARNPYIDFAQRKRFSHDWKVMSFVLWYELFFNENTALFEQVQDRACVMSPAEDHGYAPQFLGSWSES